MYENFDAQYVNPNTAEGKLGKPSFTVPTIPMAFPSGAGFSENDLYLNDTANRRVIRTRFPFRRLSKASDANSLNTDVTSS
jgi:hypothetical protein